MSEKATQESQVANIIKRDGRVVLYSPEKVYDAIIKAFKEVDGAITDDAKSIATSITEYISKQVRAHKGDVGVEAIQDIIEERLMASRRKDVAKAYVIYRNDRSRIRNRNSDLMRRIRSKLNADDIENQNANIDERSFGGRMGAVNGEVMKQYALDECMSEMAKNNHLNNEIYIHDLDHYAVGDHNCLSIPFDDLLAKGFNTRQTDVRPAQSVSTAFQLVAVIFQLQSLQQFGGVSATHIDHTMVPYVRKSFYKHYVDGLKYVEGLELKGIYLPSELPIDDMTVYTHEKSYDYAMDMTTKEVYQAVEGMYHNLKHIWVA